MIGRSLRHAIRPAIGVIRGLVVTHGILFYYSLERLIGLIAKLPVTLNHLFDTKSRRLSSCGIHNLFTIPHIVCLAPAGTYWRLATII